MPDEVVVEEKPKDTSAALDPEVLGKQIAQAAQDAVRSFVSQNPQDQTREPAAPVDALEEVVGPIVDRRAGRATLIAQLAADKADFYAIEDTEELALRLHFKEEVEKRSMGLAQQGHALPRIDILRHLKGEQEDKLGEFRQKRRKIREDRVRSEGGDEGGGAIPREGGMPRSVTGDAAYGLQAEGKLETFLGDKEF